jgi:hypothetical protein
MPQPSLAGSRYILVFTDDLSCKSWTYFLHSKDETFDRFRIFKEKIESETENKIKVLRTDRGGQYLLHEFKQYCNKNGISRELTQAATPQQNGVAERWNRTIIERARSMSIDSNLPNFLWTKAVWTATYLINRSPTRANFGVTPEERYSSRKPDVSHLRIFGCIVYSHIPKTERKKMNSKTRRCLFLGYDEESKVYRLYDKTNRKILLNRDVIFDETRVGFHHLADETAVPENILQFTRIDTTAETW